MITIFIFFFIGFSVCASSDGSSYRSAPIAIPGSRDTTSPRQRASSASSVGSDGFYVGPPPADTAHFLRQHRERRLRSGTGTYELLKGHLDEADLFCPGGLFDDEEERRTQQMSEGIAALVVEKKRVCSDDSDVVLQAKDTCCDGEAAPSHLPFARDRLFDERTVAIDTRRIMTLGDFLYLGIGWGKEAITERNVARVVRRLGWRVDPEQALNSELAEHDFRRLEKHFEVPVDYASFEESVTLTDVFLLTGFDPMDDNRLLKKLQRVLKKESDFTEHSPLTYYDMQRLEKFFRRPKGKFASLIKHEGDQPSVGACSKPIRIRRPE